MESALGKEGRSGATASHHKARVPHILSQLTCVPPVVPDERALGPERGPAQLALMVLTTAVGNHVGLEDATLRRRGSEAQAVPWTGGLVPLADTAQDLGLTVLKVL